jgi:hypothetical protein
MEKPGWPRGHTLKVRVTPEERAQIERLAAATSLPVATYLRTLGLAFEPKSTVDADSVLALLKLGGDLLDRPGDGAPIEDVRTLLHSIGELRDLIADKVAAL